MQELISVKSVVGLVSATVITGTMAAGINLETSSVPAHWFFGVGRANHTVEVNLVSRPNDGNSCEWISQDPTRRFARCPTIQVIAKRSGAAASDAVAGSQDNDRGDLARLAARTNLNPDKHL
jgi:hypothetical protein